MWEKNAFYNLAEGFWATRVAKGLTTHKEAVKRVEEQKAAINLLCDGRSR